MAVESFRGLSRGFLQTAAEDARLIVWVFDKERFDNIQTNAEAGHIQGLTPRTLNRWLERENEKRGTLWTVLAAIAALVLAGFALL